MNAALPLATLLSDMIAAAALTGTPSRRTLPGGLHLAVQVQGTRRRISAWRDGGVRPSHDECLIVARDAGFRAPVFHDWARPDGSVAVLISEARAPVTSLPDAPEPDSQPVVDVQRPAKVKESAAQRRAREAREAHFSARYRRALLCVSLLHAVTAPDRWWRRGDVLAARAAYIRGATYKELLTEVQGRYHQAHHVRALDVLPRVRWALTRWRLRYRALNPEVVPVVSVPARRAHISRIKGRRQ